MDLSGYVKSLYKIRTNAYIAKYSSLYKKHIEEKAGTLEQMIHPANYISEYNIWSMLSRQFIGILDKYRDSIISSEANIGEVKGLYLADKFCLSNKASRGKCLHKGIMSFTCVTCFLLRIFYSTDDHSFYDIMRKIHHATIQDYTKPVHTVCEDTTLINNLKDNRIYPCHLMVRSNCDLFRDISLPFIKLRLQDDIGVFAKTTNIIVPRQDLLTILASLLTNSVGKSAARITFSFICRSIMYRSFKINTAIQFDTGALLKSISDICSSLNKINYILHNYTDLVWVRTNNTVQFIPSEGSFNVNSMTGKCRVTYNKKIYDDMIDTDPKILEETIDLTTSSPCKEKARNVARLKLSARVSSYTDGVREVRLYPILKHEKLNTILSNPSKIITLRNKYIRFVDVEDYIDKTKFKTDMYTSTLNFHLLMFALMAQFHDALLNTLIPDIWYKNFRPSMVHMVKAFCKDNHRLYYSDPKSYFKKVTDFIQSTVIVYPVRWSLT